MSLQLYTRVLWRFRYLVLCGFIIATALAVVSYAHVSFSGGHARLTPRKAEVWNAETRLLLAPHGFPQGAYAQPNSPTGPSFNPDYLATLAVTYAEYAGSDAVRRLALRNSPVKGTISADVESTLAGLPTQVIDLQVASGSAHGAMTLSGRATDALQQYVSEQQRAYGTPTDKRVVLDVLTKPAKPTLLVPRKKTLSIVAFIAIMTAFVGLAFVLENMRPGPESLIARRISAAPEPSTLR